MVRTSLEWNRWLGCLKGDGVVVLAVEEVVVDGVGEEAGDVVLGLEGLEGVGHIVELLVLVEPVVAEPWGGLDEVPPLRGEVLHLPERRRDEERRLRVQRRRDHGAHDFLLAGQIKIQKSKNQRQNRKIFTGPKGF